MASFSDLDTLRQMGLVSLVYNNAGVPDVEEPVEITAYYAADKTGVYVNGWRIVYDENGNNLRYDPDSEYSGVAYYHTSTGQPQTIYQIQIKKSGIKVQVGVGISQGLSTTLQRVVLSKVPGTSRTAFTDNNEENRNLNQGVYNLYNYEGSTIPYPDNKILTITGYYYSSSSSDLQPSTGVLSFVNNNGNLAVNILVSSLLVQRIAYTVQQLINQLCLKFSCAGTGITFTGALDSAYIIAAIKQQMTVDNIGLMGMIGPMGGMMTEYVPLPTVSTTWLVITPGTGDLDIPTDGENEGYWWDSGSQSYISADWDSGVTYGMIAFYTMPITYAGRMELEIKEVSGTVGVHNVSSSTVTVWQANIAVCSSNLATIITVYNSSNNPYNAFKYTSDGTDYYYVLDGTQTDWTDDLSSIGYKLPTIGYLTSIKIPKSMNPGGLETLYDENGTKMTVSTYGVSYPAVRVYSSSSDTTGTAVVNENWTVHGPQFYSGDLSVSNLTGSIQIIQRITFIK